MDVLDQPPRQKRPGGRTAEVTRRIYDAVLELLAEGGMDACTFQNVAARAGVEILPYVATVSRKGIILGRRLEARL